MFGRKEFPEVHGITKEMLLLVIKDALKNVSHSSIQTSQSHRSLGAGVFICVSYLSQLPFQSFSVSITLRGLLSSEFTWNNWTVNQGQEDLKNST